MKSILSLLVLILSITSAYSQFKSDTIYVNEPNYTDIYVYVTQQLDDSTMIAKKIVEDKKIMQLTYFNLVDSVWVGTSTITFQNGKTISTTEWSKEGTGFTRQYSDDGNIISISELVGFKNNGKYFGFYPNGLLKEKGNFKDFLKTGEWVSFAENGDTLAVKNYMVKDVSLISFSEYTTDEFNSFQWGGTLENELVSLPHGIFKTFFNGKLESIIEYKEGKIKK